ncbi:FAD:protein FMN transferase [Rathayibacter sp. KR2-224]|uniref:FAD:protein FMN transferase n=1 Tax=Rathayibacter sp. KR2-224 TaxID=3400913 RepID=UPI003C0E3C02
MTIHAKTGAPARRDWKVWGLDASVVVDDSEQLDAAEHAVREVLDAVDLACSRFRSDSELSLLRGRLAHGATVSPMLAALVTAALQAAELSGGDVDPTLGNDLEALGYDRDIAQLQTFGTSSATVRVLRRPEPGWRRVALHDGLLTVPDDLTLDLGASAKAVAADLSAQRIEASLGTAVLVSLGGDLATAGRPRDDAWEVLVRDTADDPGQQVRLAGGWAMATSSTQKRRWMADGHHVHHILDPRSGLPAAPVWRTATVVAPTCLRANALSTAAIVRGTQAVGWLAAQGAPARLVDEAGRIHVTEAWPSDIGRGDDVVR